MRALDVAIVFLGTCGRRIEPGYTYQFALKAKLESTLWTYLVLVLFFSEALSAPRAPSDLINIA